MTAIDRADDQQRRRMELRVHHAHAGGGGEQDEAELATLCQEECGRSAGGLPSSNKSAQPKMTSPGQE